MHIDKWNDLEAIYRSGDYIILDTETTGVRYPCEIVQIAVLDGKTGKTLYSKLVRPLLGMSATATAIHGITAEMVEKAEPWATQRLYVYDLIYGRNVVVYNADYDRGMFAHSDRAAGINSPKYHEIANWYCAMLWYADHYGEWDDYHGSNRWQSLSKACLQQGVTLKGAHDALGDCLLTWGLINSVMSKKDNGNAPKTIDAE